MRTIQIKAAAAQKISRMEWTLTVVNFNYLVMIVPESATNATVSNNHKNKIKKSIKLCFMWITLDLSLFYSHDIIFIIFGERSFTVVNFFLCLAYHVACFRKCDSFALCAFFLGRKSKLEIG